ncbi:MAG: hypothetical protein U0U69_02305 [Acidimicrobiia bacterium]
MPRVRNAVAAAALTAGLVFAAAPASAQTPTTPTPTSQPPTTQQQQVPQYERFGPMGRHRMDWDDRGDGNERGRGMPGPGAFRAGGRDGGWGLLWLAAAGLGALVVLAVGALIGFLIGRGRGRRRNDTPAAPPQYAPVPAQPAAVAAAPVYTPPAAPPAATVDTGVVEEPGTPADS